MKKQREVEFEENYSVITFASAITFTSYFFIFIFILNLIYIPSIFKSSGFAGILLLLSHYFLTSIVLAPILIIFNGMLGLVIKKIMKIVYVENKLLGFIVYPLVMTIIPLIIILLAKSAIGSIHTFDYYYIYITTWLSSILQYTWLLKNMNNQPESLNKKQADFLKNIDHLDYF